MWCLLALFALPLARGDVFKLGYLTGSQRRPGDHEYARPGLSISGAISLAVAELNAGPIGDQGHRLEFVVAETRGDELASIARTADLWTRNVAAYIGPQETCVTEARMAAAFNLPMISYVSTALRPLQPSHCADRSRYKSCRLLNVSADNAVAIFRSNVCGKLRVFIKF
jgi:ABC-type branched-subunit amino acid transport system substrate-binding protein